jgi:hypothetical protein
MIKEEWMHRLRNRGLRDEKKRTRNIERRN